MLTERIVALDLEHLRIPAHRGHQFRRIVGSDSGPSWAPIPVHRGQFKRLMLEPFHWRQTS
ncbi:MAG TPA: hypothetical protein VKB05_07370, partial [Pyrinomonadaceae bacterium]|nr:hypothetical protein [Pyrinomonadaceae bacterium]